MAVSPENVYCQVYEHLVAIGCCDVCCLRFLGNRSKSSFRSVSAALKHFGIQCEENVTEPSNKLAKPNPCVGCLGLLQPPYANAIIDEIVSSVNVTIYDTKTFNLSMSLPSCFLLREAAVLVNLNEKFPAFWKENLDGQPLLSLKDGFKHCHVQRLEEMLNLTLDVNSGFLIELEFKYNDDFKECECLKRKLPAKFSTAVVNKHGYRKTDVEWSLEALGNELSKIYQVPPAIPSVTIAIAKTAVVRESTNVAGRYLKYSRSLPQTPWLLNGKRIMESSVEEVVSSPIVALLGGTSSKFASSGREDVDVRSLGQGRPFNVEVLSPRTSELSFDQLRALETQINELAKGQLRVRDLQIVTRESLTKLKQGEEEKSKEYRALCVCPNGVPDCLEEAAKRAPLVLDQSTPVRVLHRRPVAVRQRSILKMSTERLEGNDTQFILNLTTQAGTYIKEFVHGDLGRTKPSFGELLGGVEVDILALDVMAISLDWPPTVDYAQNQNVDAKS